MKTLATALQKVSFGFRKGRILLVFEPLLGFREKHVFYELLKPLLAFAQTTVFYCVFNEKYIIFHLWGRKRHVFYELFETPLRVRENNVFCVLCEPLLGFRGIHIFT